MDYTSTSVRPSEGADNNIPVRRRSVELEKIASSTPPALVNLPKVGNSGGGCLVAMQPEGFLPPLYFIHHLLGNVLIYTAIAEYFAPERPIVGIQIPAGLKDRGERCTVESLASEYIKEILEQQSTGPFHLAGFSSGATLAFEMAKQLTGTGHRVGLLALIDADANAPGPDLSKAARYFKIAVRKVCKIIFKLSDELKEGPKQFITKRVRYVCLRWRMRNLMRSPRSCANELPLEQILLLADNTYRPTPYLGAALLFRFHDEAWAFGPDPLMGWSSLVQSCLAVVDFPGGHITGMEPSRARRLADILKAQIAQNEAENVAVENLADSKVSENGLCCTKEFDQMI
jgi:thioesterase domain-containing protein